MPWENTCAMDERMRFVTAASADGAVMSEVCEDFGISRQTGYKWLKRYHSEGVNGLKELSRAPLQHGLARPEELVRTIMALRERWPHWGARKLRQKLAELKLETQLPAASTIGDWLRSKGLTRPQRRRRRCAPYTQPFSEVSASNDVWAIDFKGWFRTGDNMRCDPLTLSDAFSRALLRCEAVARPDHDHVRPILEAAFCEFGLPRAIRSDNGPPFASLAAGGLSALSVWWIKLGITPERIDPGKPQQNGRHERMHGTLNQETAKPPASTLRDQQQRFDLFRREYNEQRPHEALGQKTPASIYQPSHRSYPCRPQEPVYDVAQAVRRVRSNGEIKWGGELIFVSEVLVGEPVGIAETENGDWLVRFADVELGVIDRKQLRFHRPASPKRTNRSRGRVDNASALPTSPQDNQQKTT
jgi:transposase InsO family protein